MGKQGRKKKRTHVPASDIDLIKTPKSFVVQSGKVGAVAGQLVRDIRRVMEPNTASNLKERSSNKLRDFVMVAGQLSVSHLLLFSKASGSAVAAAAADETAQSRLNLRIARFPRGPTLSFHINSYSLCKDVLSLQPRPKSPGSDYKTAPLVVLNQFNQAASGGARHFQLMTTMLQNLFPPIHVSKMKLTDARRVVLFQYNAEDGTVDMRHYAIAVKMTGVSKPIKSILQANIPDLTKLEDMGDLLMTECASESEAEEAEILSLPQKYVGRGNSVAEKRAIKLVELGPRLNLSLVKIEDGLCQGEVIYHSYIKKSKKEIASMELKRSEKKKRKKIQEENVAAKKQRMKEAEDDASQDEEALDDEDEENSEEFASDSQDDE